MSSRDSIDAEALRWLRYCDDDLDVASRLLTGSPSAPRHVCWLSQQAAEKALKAVLVLQQVDFPLVHDLNALRNLLPEGWSVPSTRQELSALTVWSTQARYPGGWLEATDCDATIALSQASSIRESIAAQFRSQGILD